MSTQFVVPNLDRPSETYLTRWRLIQTPWAAVYLHRMDGPDSRPTLHDHPWGFLSLVLAGGYEEVANLPSDTQDPIPGNEVVRRWRRGSVHRMRRQDAHYIRRLLGRPTWTLLLVGPRRGTWGYWDQPSENGYRWTAFDRHPYAVEFDRAMAQRKEIA